MMKRIFAALLLMVALTATGQRVKLDECIAVSGNYGNLDGTYLCSGQSWTASATAVLDSVKLFVYKIGSPTGYFRVQIYAHTGTYGTSSKPTGSVLAQSDSVSMAGLPTSRDSVVFKFTGSNKVQVTQGAYYTLVCQYFNYGVNSTNYAKVNRSSAGTDHPGNRFYSTSCSTYSTSSSGDVCFKVYGALPSVTTVKAINGVPVANIDKAGTVSSGSINKINGIGL